MVRLEHRLYALEISAPAPWLWSYRLQGSDQVHTIAPPAFEVDGRVVVANLTEVHELAPAERLSVNILEHRYLGTLAGDADLSLELVLRVADGSPMVRFAYVLHARAAHQLTKADGRDQLQYATLITPGDTQIWEITMGEFNELTHAYMLNERAVPERAFTGGLCLPGPILASSTPAESVVLAYEHGSNLPNTYVQYRLASAADAPRVATGSQPKSGARKATVEAVKGSYYAGQVVDTGHPYQTIWLEIGAVRGGLDELAAAYRHFVLDYLGPQQATRRPLIFYNTWAYQERNRHWHGRPYLESMNEERMLAEIEAAHHMGIEVFVLDTGWYAKTGDWDVDRTRFPRGLAPLKARLDAYGMQLGLWFNPGAAALSSRLHEVYRDCVESRAGAEARARPIWETEESHTFCLVSRYSDAFTAELIRLHRELGVTYFKWDAVHQEKGCSSPNHQHGGSANSDQERAECYEFELVRALTHIAEQVNAACPDAIVDLDMTESGRCMGLGFLAAGKYFLINNGPYYANYDLPQPGTNANIFFYPGAARAMICRAGLSYDRWIPSVLFLTHYLPDDTPAGLPGWNQPHGVADSQEVNLASLILGGNGIWGDLVAVSPEGVARFGEVLTQYRRVREAVTHADPVRDGMVGATPEIHEKLSAGAGVVVIFSSQRGSFVYVTQHSAGAVLWSSPGVAVDHDDAGRARIGVVFTRPGAKIIFFARADSADASTEA